MQQILVLRIFDLVSYVFEESVSFQKEAAA